MSSVDERIVKMVFDNSEFTSKIASTISSLTQLNKATDQIANNSGSGLSAMGKAFEQAEITSTRAGFHIQDVWLKVASILEYQVAGKIVQVGKDIANAMTFKGIADGFNEYELKMGSIQTIMAGTGESLETVNKYLNELNTYSDKTIYSFADMTNNIGKFTNAGVKLDDAVLAIKGIANEAARSGANANEASRAMYNFSQALSAGYVKLIDWKSIENANMATKEFKDTLLEVASSVGTVEKQADGMYKVLTTNAQGKTMDDLVSGTKNFNDSLQQQWMTTDVLTKTMKIYATDVRDMSEAEKEAYENELRSIGFNEEQIIRFENLGSAATDAASEIKTFNMMMDTLKEAIGSGWAQTWEIIIGDFEEGKALWTEVGNVLSDLIDRSSKARNDLLEGWDTLGGRAALIDALKRAFEALVAVVKPIADGFRNIFPPVTAVNLLNITKALQRFTANLMISEETANKVRQAASGFFAIFDIGIKFIKSFINAILPASKGVSSLAGFLLDAAAKVGNFLTKVDLVITKTKLFDVVFASIGNVIQNVISFLGQGIGVIGSFLSGVKTGFSGASKPIRTFGDVFKAVFDGISSIVENIKSKLGGLKTIFDGLAIVFKGIGTVIGQIFKQIGDSLSGVSLNGGGINGLMSLVNALLTGGILYKLSQGLDIFSKFGDVLDGFGDVLDGFAKKVQSETLMNVAKAVAILAGSLVVVSLVDTNKLAGATTAIGTMVAIMAGAMTLIMKAVNSFSTEKVSSTFSLFGKNIFGMNATKLLEMSVTLGAVAKVLVSMGAAVLMMSIGLKAVSSAAEGGHLWDSFAVVSLMLAELTAVAIVLGKWGNESKKGASGLITMSASLILLAEALKMISKVVESGNAWESLGILSIILGELTGIVVIIDHFTDYSLSSMLPLISLAVSLNLVVVALKSVSDALGNDGNHIWESLGIISIILAELAAVCVVLGQFAGGAILGGAGAIMAAAALLVVVQALKQINDLLSQSDNNVWQSLGVIGASLGILAIGLTAMSASLPGAAALVVASAGLVVLGAALKIIGSLSLAEIGKGLLAMAGSLLILAVGLTAMIVALPGAAALIVAAAGLTVLAGALKLLGSMGIGEIISALGAMIVALTGIAVVTTVLSVASPFILAFSAALLVFGAAMTVTGAGLTLFAAGLQVLVPLLPMVATAINVLGTALLDLLPILVEKLVEALAALCSKIIEYAPTFTEATITIISSILDALAASTIKFGETVLTIILGILQVLTENIPLIAKAGTDLMIAYMQAISNEIPRVVDEAYKCAIALINGLADAIESNNGELIAAVDHLMNAAIQAITQWLVEFTPLGLLIPENVKEGIMSGEFNVKDAVDNVIKNAVDGIKSFFGEFKKAAEYLVDGLIEGLIGTGVGKAVSAAAELGSKIIGGLNSPKGLDEHSPSLKAILSGLMVAMGLKEGMEEGTPDAVEASEELGDKTVGVLSDKMADGADSISDSASDIANSIKGMTNEVNSGGGLLDTIQNVITEVNNLDDVSKANIKTTNEAREAEERWMTTDKIQRAEIKKSVQAKKEGYMTTMDVIEASNKAHQTEEAYTESIEENTKAQEENAKATGKSGTAAKQSANVMEYASGVVEAFTKHYGHLYTTLGDDGPTKVAAFAVRNLAEETYKASLAAEKATDKNKETKATIEDLVKSFTELKTKLYDSVKSFFEGDNFFQKFEVKTEMTMQTLLENMRSNIDGVTSWSNKLVELGNKGVNEGLLRQLAELGPKGFEYVNAFSNATTEEIAMANELFAQAAVLPDSVSNSVVASYAQAGLNCLQGFANGIDQNVAIGSQSIETAATTYLKDFMSGLKESSPSKATYQDGMWLIMGLTSGMENYSYMAHNKIVEITLDIVHTAERNLDQGIFYNFGQSIGEGLAAGMNASAGAVRAAAENLSAIAASVTTSYNGIHSPAKRYQKYGNYIGEGLALGMKEEAPQVEKSASFLSQAVRKVLETVDEITHDEMELHPVISPVLDLTDLRENAGLIGSLFPGRSIALASSVGASMNASGFRSSGGTTNNAYTYGGNTFYISARDGESADQIADKVISKLDRQTSRRKAVNGA